MQLASVSEAFRAAFFISRRTVSAHLSHIFTKLGLRSRVELAAEMPKGSRGVGKN